MQKRFVKSIAIYISWKLFIWDSHNYYHSVKEYWIYLLSAENIMIFRLGTHGKRKWSDSQQIQVDRYKSVDHEIGRAIVREETSFWKNTKSFLSISSLWNAKRRNGYQRYDSRPQILNMRGWYNEKLLSFDGETCEIIGTEEGEEVRTLTTNYSIAAYGLEW